MKTTSKAEATKPSTVPANWSRLSRATMAGSDATGESKTRPRRRASSPAGAFHQSPHSPQGYLVSRLEPVATTGFKLAPMKHTEPSDLTSRSGLALKIPPFAL
eukprot:21870-Eustigmatos_ZCMA.PRE.1